MQIDSLSTLRKVIKLCRENGVTSISIDGITMSIALTSNKTIPKESSIFDNLELPPEASMAVPQYTDSTYQQQIQPDKIETETLTEEQMLMWSARPEDPSIETM